MAKYTVVMWMEIRKKPDYAKYILFKEDLYVTHVCFDGTKSYNWINNPRLSMIKDTGLWITELETTEKELVFVKYPELI